MTRGGTAEPVSLDQILRHVRGQGNIIFPVQLTTSRIGNLTRLIHTLLYVMTLPAQSECFNDWGGRGYDDSVPGEVIKTTPSGIGLYHPLHGRQNCLEFSSFHQRGGSNKSPGGANFVPSLPRWGQICDIPPPPPIVEVLIRPCHRSHSMPLALILPRGDQ